MRGKWTQTMLKLPHKVGVRAVGLNCPEHREGIVDRLDRCGARCGGGARGGDGDRGSGRASGGREPVAERSESAVRPAYAREKEMEITKEEKQKRQNEKRREKRHTHRERRESVCVLYVCVCERERESERARERDVVCTAGGDPRDQWRLR